MGFLATELVAAVVVAAQQANAGASVERQITVALGVIGIITFVWAVAKFVAKPLLHAWYWAVPAHEPERGAVAWVKALDHDEDTRAVARRFIDRLYADTLKEQQETRDMAEANKDAIEFLKASQTAMGEALTRELSVAVKEFTRSNETQTRELARSNDVQAKALEEMQKELRKLTEAYVRLDERFATHYEGPERRKHPR